MTEKQKHWIVDTEGTHALVEGADERDRWTRVRGWTEAAEPDGHHFVWLRNENPDIGPARLSWEAAQLDAWAARGWAPGAPPEPVNAATAHWPAAAPVAEPAPKSSPASKTATTATSGNKKEQ